MLLVIDNLLPEYELAGLRTLCLSHHQLRQFMDGSGLFSWLPTQDLSSTARSAHSTKSQAIVQHYLNQHLLPRVEQFTGSHAGAEWWCNTNNDLDWHIDKDEAEYQRTGCFQLPLLSTVFYPYVSCAGGELLIADNPPVMPGSCDDLPDFRSVISIPPVINRLVLFSAGLIHRINPFDGERYSVAVNIWANRPSVISCQEN